MEKQTLDNLEAAIEAVGQELSGRVAELAAKSSSRTLSSDERDQSMNKSSGSMIF